MTQPDEKFREMTSIPVDGADAWKGAAAFLAVLAYPEQTEWTDRDKVISAFGAWLDRESIARRKMMGKLTGEMRLSEETTKIEVRDMYGIINKCKKRIVNYRLPAGDMVAGNIAWDREGVGQADSWRDPRSGKIISTERMGLTELFASALVISAKKNARRIGMPEECVDGIKACRVSSPKGHITSFVKVVAKRSSGNNDVGINDGMYNVFKRHLKTSRPVIHMCIALRWHLSVKNNRKNQFDIFEMVARPGWVRGVLADAERWRGILQLRSESNAKPGAKRRRWRHFAAKDFVVLKPMDSAFSDIKPA